MAHKDSDYRNNHQLSRKSQIELAHNCASKTMKGEEMPVNRDCQINYANAVELRSIKGGR
ncbi:MAG: hypothetical protein ACKKL5_00410 [Candidatus Komeilibacteria bacterium]